MCNMNIFTSLKVAAAVLVKTLGFSMMLVEVGCSGRGRRDLCWKLMELAIEVIRGVGGICCLECTAGLRCW